MLQPGNLYLSWLIKRSVKLAGCAFHKTPLPTFWQFLLLNRYSSGITAMAEIPRVAIDLSESYGQLELDRASLQNHDTVISRPILS
jgi:hypothetical protein